MKRLIALFLSICLLLVPLVGCIPRYQGGDFTDDLGRTVNIGKAPQRIVSHVPSITETLFALGLSDRLVGVSDYCDYPPDAKNKPSIGDYFNPSIENIVALEPDLVLTDGHSESIKKLEALDIPFFTIDPKDIEGVMKDIELLGKITGAEKQAASLVSGMRQEILAVSSRVKDAPKIKTLYVVDTTNPAVPWVAGPGSFIDAMVRLSGGDNVASSAKSAWAEFSIEAIVAADPEVIIVSEEAGGKSKTADDIRNSPAWQGISAVKNNRIRIVYADPVVRTGPRITQGLQLIAGAIHPEIFR